MIHETPIQWLDDDRVSGMFFDPDADDDEDSDGPGDDFICGNALEGLYKDDGQELLLKRGKGMDQLDKWQVDSAMATWEAMRKIMPVEAWMVY